MFWLFYNFHQSLSGPFDWDLLDFPTKHVTLKTIHQVYRSTGYLFNFIYKLFPFERVSCRSINGLKVALMKTVPESEPFTSTLTANATATATANIHRVIKLLTEVEFKSENSQRDKKSEALSELVKQGDCAGGSK